MANTQTVALDFLTKLEADLNAHNNRGTASIYNFAGYRNGQPVGITKTTQVSLNRGGQIFQFLAGYYTRTTDTNIKARIATAAGKVYKIFAARPIFSSYSLPNPVGDFAVTGVFTPDPSPAFMMIGLMMIDKQGVIDHANFTANSGVATSYVRGTQIARQALKINHAFTVGGYTDVFKEFKAGENYTWATQKMATRALNGSLSCLAALSTYTKLYGVSTYSARFTEAQTIFRLVPTKFGNTYVSGSLVSVTAAGQQSGGSLCLPIGGHEQARGPFPSVGYNSVIGFAMTLQAFAENANTSSKFTQMQTLASGHVLQIEAGKLMNYYRERVANDGILYEIGAHRNYAGDASRFKADWQADLNSRGKSPSFDPSFSGGFGFLLDKNNNPGATGYAYSFMWSNPTHALFSNIASKFGPSSGKPTIDINYGPVGTSAAVIQAFAATGEAACARAISGLGALLMYGTTTVS